MTHLGRSATWFASLLLLLPLLATAAFLEDSLPLELVSISPSSATNEGTLLRGSDPLTIVFSRPIIALGSDFQALDESAPGGLDMPDDKMPFSLSTRDGAPLNVQGKLRWPTTYIARFDPDEPWPSDLHFSLELNEGLTSHDGVPLKIRSTQPTTMAYKTEQLTGSLSAITSELASAATNGAWKPAVSEGEDPEVPADGELTVAFSHPVDVQSLKAGFVLSKKGGVLGRESLDVSPCERDADKCALLRPRGLEDGASYTITLPVGAEYHPLAGPLTKEVTMRVHGLYPFAFTPKEFSEWNLPRHTRVDCYLRHGLADSVSVDAFKPHLLLLDPKGQSLGYSLTQADNVTLRVVAPLEPNTEYTLRFASSAAILDGFGLAFQGSSLRFSTASVDAFSVNDVDQAAVFYTPNSPANVHVLSRGCIGSCNQRRSTSLLLAPITAANVQQMLAFDGYSENGVVSSMQEMTASQGAELSVESRPLPGNLFLRQTRSTDRNGRYTNTHFNGLITSVTELSLTVMSSSDSILVWITSMATGENVAGADVVLFEERGYSSKTITRAQEATTGADGMASIPAKELQGGQIIVYVSTATDQTLLKVWYNKPYVNERQEYYLTAVTDRGVYKPGEWVNVKAFLRAQGDKELVVPAQTRATMTVTWENPTAPNWEAVEEKIPCVWDKEYGTFHTSFQVPEGTTFDYKQLEFRQDDQGWAGHLGSTTLKVADPRRPTATLDLDDSKPVWVSSEAYAVEATVLTGTGLPIAGTEVSVEWTLTRQATQSPAGPYRYDAPWVPPTEITGTFVMSTDADGVAAKDFLLEEESGSGPALPGDDVSFAVTVVGPTGAVLEDSLYVRVQQSKLSLSVSAGVGAPWDSLPNVPYGWTVAVTDEHGSPSTRPVDLKLFRAIDFDASEDDAEAVWSCGAESGTGELQCPDFALPSAHDYVLVASLEDDLGVAVTQNTRVGRSAEQWEENPVSSVGYTTFTLDQDSYAVGDTAAILFESKYERATLLVGVGDSLTQHPVALGDNSVDVEVVKECKGGCNIMLLLSVPAQSERFVGLFSEVPVSTAVDLAGPRTLESSVYVNVPDRERSLEVSVTPSAEQASPGDVLDITVELVDPDTREAVVGEVAIFVVDQAFLDVEPHPLTELNESFAIRSYTAAPQVRGDNRQDLASWAWLEANIEAFTRRLAQDPWQTPEWSRWNKYLADQSDEEFFKDKSSQVTQWGRNVQYGSYSGGFGGGGYGGFGGYEYFMEDSFGSFGGGAMGGRSMPMAMAFAAPAPMAETMVVNVAMDADESMGNMKARGAERAGPAGAGAAAGTGTTANIPVRTRFETTPLAVGRMVVNGTGSVRLTLPGTIGRFSIRAYAVDRESRFGQAESSVVANKPVALQPLFPRFARTGDEFDCGVTLAGGRSDMNATVTISVEALGSTVAVAGGDSMVVQLSGTTPMPVRFPMTATSLGDMSFRFTASAVTETGDAFEDGFEVLPVQDPVTVATSMAIQGSEDGSEWEESLQFPAMVKGSGTVGITAGVGRLVAIQNLAELVFRPLGRYTDNSYVGAETWLSRVLFHGVLDQYDAASAPAKESVFQKASSALEEAVGELALLTHDHVGLRWSRRYSVRTDDEPDARTNAMGLYAALRLALFKDPEAYTVAPFSSAKSATSRGTGSRGGERGSVSPPGIGGGDMMMPVAPPIFMPDDFGGIGGGMTEPGFGGGFAPPGGGFGGSVPVFGGRRLLQRGMVGGTMPSVSRERPSITSPIAKPGFDVEGTMPSVPTERPSIITGIAKPGFDLDEYVDVSVPPSESLVKDEREPISMDKDRDSDSDRDWTGTGDIDKEGGKASSSSSSSSSSSGSSGPPALEAFTQQWAAALKRAVVLQYYDAVRYGNRFSDWDLLADCILLFGADYVGDASHASGYRPAYGPTVPTTANPSSVLNLGSLTRVGLEQLPFSTQLKLAQAMLLRPSEKSPELGELVNQVVLSMLSQVHVQGRTAYLKAAPGSSHAASYATQAAALDVLALFPSAHPFVEKIANYLSQGNAGRAGSLFSYSAFGSARAAVALSDYDESRDSTNPDVDLAVMSGEQPLLAASFDASSALEPVTVVVSADDIPVQYVKGAAASSLLPEDLSFTATGQGEVSVAAFMEFVPAVISPDPIYRGIFVERLVQTTVEGEGKGPALHMAEQGDFVTVTIQVTTPDDLQAVTVEDLLPGGLEALESDDSAPFVPVPYYSSGGRGGRGGGMRGFLPYFRPWRSPFEDAEVRPDRVRFTARHLRAGTHTVSYRAVAITTGAFVHPPTKASVAAQPELMGLSGAGQFFVTEGGGDSRPRFEQAIAAIPEEDKAMPRECADVCMLDEACNTRTGECVSMVMRRQAPESRPSEVQGLRRTRLFKREVTLHWEAPASGFEEGVDKYLVQFRLAGLNMPWRPLPGGAGLTQTTYRATDLDPATRYVFRVFAIKAGDTSLKSPPSTLALVTRRADAPPRTARG